MNNRHCHSLRSAAVFPSSLPKLITDLKKVTVRGIESRLRRGRGRSDDRRARGGAGKTTFNFSNGNIGFYDLLLMITTRREAGDTLCILCDHRRAGVCAGCESGRLHMWTEPGSGVSGPGLREAATRGRDFSPGPGPSHVTRRGSRVREEAGRRQRYEQVSYNSLAVIQHRERRNPHLWQWLD